MVSEYTVDKVIELFKSVIPEVWKIAIKQVVALNIRDTIINVFLLILIGILVYFCVNSNKHNYWEDSTISTTFYIAFGLVPSSIIFIANLIEIVMRLTNPEYYALKIILGFPY